MSKLYYGNELVNKWYDGSDNINKAYYGDTLMFGNETPSAFPNLCYGVTDDISTYTATTFDMVYDTTQEAWYMLNNLNQYELYGIIENVDSLSNATHYNGKLVIYDSYEYEWNNGTWNNLGEVIIQQDIPIGYTQLEWVNGEGGEIWLDDVYAKSTLKSQLKLRYTVAGGSIFYGTSGSSDNSDYRIFKYANSTYIDVMSERISGSWLTSTTTDYEIEFGNFYLKNLQTGTNYGTGTTQSAFDYTGDNAYKLKVFGSSEQGRLYYLKIYDNDTLVRHFYPCYRNSDGVVGLYDVVTDKFYASSGSVTSGDTSGGSIVVPKEYDEKSDPDNNIIFDTMEEAYAYDGCVYVGITALIDEIGYLLNDEYEWEIKPVLNYLQFTARNGSATIGMSGSSSPNVSYSRNGYTWTTWDYSNLTIPQNETIYFKGNNPNGFNTYSSSYKRFRMSGTIEGGGNVMSLLYGDDFVGQLTIPNDYCFRYLFQNCTSLTTAPQLPATTLKYSCYQYMFKGCTSLTTAPTLPATTLTSGCYQDMFFNCLSLTQAPSLPATTLAQGCYEYMFQGCTSLITAPQLPATTLSEWCYNSMFANTNVLPDCSNIDFTSQSVVASGGLKGLFIGTKVTDNDLMSILPKDSNNKYCLPVTTLAENCYYNMFSGCTSLTTAPQLPATTMKSYCYDGMFRDCTSLTTAPVLPATTLAESCYANMFQGCTSLTTAPQLPATRLQSNCYYYMFYGCSRLNYIKAMFTTTPSSAYTSYWVSGVAASGTFVKNGNASWSVGGVNGIPYNWTVETETPPTPVATYKARLTLQDDTIVDIPLNGSSTLTSEELEDYRNEMVSAEITTAVTSIGDSAFTNSYMLSSVIIPDSVTTIGNEVFVGSVINMIEIGNGITSIGYDFVKECWGLSQVFLYTTSFDGFPCSFTWWDEYAGEEGEGATVHTNATFTDANTGEMIDIDWCAECGSECSECDPCDEYGDCYDPCADPDSWCYDPSQCE